MVSMIPYRHSVPVTNQHKRSHISDGSISKGAKITLCTQNKLHEISKNYLMQAGKLVEKSLHRHQSHFSNKSPAAGRGRHWLLYSKRAKQGLLLNGTLSWKIKQPPNMNTGRNLEFCIFSPWSNQDGKMIFLLGNSITAKHRANIFRSSTYSCYF